MLFSTNKQTKKKERKRNKEKKKTTLIIIIIIINNRIKIQFDYFGLVDVGELIRGIGNNGGNVRANSFENGC